MKAQLNGRPVEIRHGTTVADLVAEAGAAAEARGIAVALDGVVVARGAWAETPVSEGQQVEVLEAMQGG